MPELPEVETTLRGIAPHIHGKTVQNVILRHHQLRQPITENLAEILNGETVLECFRRAKYLIIRFNTGILLIHLGMSGSLRIFTPHQAPPAQKHDHVDVVFSDGTLLRYHDPRRFGLVLWYAGAAEFHPLIQSLGVEPLSTTFTADYLYPLLQKRQSAIKNVIMDNHIVVGVGNIYANESLFYAQISPLRPANQISQQETAQLVEQIKKVLQRAIEKGGSTLRDFVDSTGNSGYFQQEYQVYGRHGQTCFECGDLIVKCVIGQRGTFYCPQCQQ